MSGLKFKINSAAAMQKLGGKLGEIVIAPIVIYLQGDLGAGKTTLVRGFLRRLGFEGKVKSPTFTLVEIYQLASNIVYHFDLYRLVGEEELEYLGIRDYFTPNSLCLIEWPELASRVLPPADLICAFRLSSKGKGREVELGSGTVRGEKMLARLAK
jgi:tRNA threonylcarbamoyladenosine biosynthesis protein TsaE